MTCLLGIKELWYNDVEYLDMLTFNRSFYGYFLLIVRVNEALFFFQSVTYRIDFKSVFNKLCRFH